MNKTFLISPENEKLRDIFSRYKIHRNGRFILGPSGIGKTTFVENQTPDANGKLDWLDADELWYACGALPEKSTEWWRKLKPNGPYDIIEIEKDCDIATSEARNAGFKMLGASCYNLHPDAIIIPDWEQHVSYIKKRESNPTEYARLGGAKSDKLDQVKNHINVILNWEKCGVPKFKSIEQAVEYLDNLENKK